MSAVDATHGLQLKFLQQDNQRIGNGFRILNGIAMTKCHTKRSFRNIIGQADGSQHMGDFRGS